MSKKKDIYKCDTCGKIIEILHDADGKLACCGEQMVLMQENSMDAAVEKHIPVLEKNGDTMTVKVGSVAHPMEEQHYIEFIELITEARSYHAFLDPGKSSEASFDIKGDVLSARAYCNLHGLWKSQ